MKIRALLLSFLIALGANAAENEIIVGATPVPHAEILNFIKPALEKQGYKLVVKEFNDYVQPNLATDSKELDANFFQHIPYLDEFNNVRKTKLVNAGAVHIEPMAVYSKKYKNIKDVKAGATVAVPNDPTNESRALDIIANAGLVSFKNVPLKTPVDIVKNPLKLKFKELKAAQVPRALDEVDLAIINSNYALGANLNPSKDSIFIESKNSPYVNIVVVKQGNENSAKIKALVKALQSDEVKKFIDEKYKGSVIHINALK